MASFVPDGEYTSTAVTVVLNSWLLSKLLSVTRDTVITFCPEFRVPAKGRHLQQVMWISSLYWVQNRVPFLSLKLFYKELHFSYILCPKTEDIALLPFKLLRSPRGFPRAAGHGDKAVPQEGLSCSCSPALPSCFGWDFSLPSSQMLLQVVSKQFSASVAFSCHFRSSQMTTQALKKTSVAAEF